MMPPLSRVNRLDRSALKRGWHACSRRKATRRGRIGSVRLVLVGESLTSRLRLALCAAFVGCAAIAASVQANAEQPATLLEEVVVVAPSLEESVPLELRQFGNRVEIINAEELALGGFNDIGQTLQMRVPGLYLAPKNGAFDYMNCALQGSRCQDILWLIDGVRINNRLYNSTSPLDTVPAHMVERVEVLYGGQGIFYGTQSVAGVVNVVTKVFSNETDASGRTATTAFTPASTTGCRAVATASCYTPRPMRQTVSSRSSTATTSRAARTGLAATRCERPGSNTVDLFEPGRASCCTHAEPTTRWTGLRRRIARCRSMRGKRTW